MCSVIFLFSHSLVIAGLTACAGVSGILSFASACALEKYRSLNPDVVVLRVQAPVEIIESAWALNHRLDVLVSNDTYQAIHGPMEKAEVADLQATRDRLVVFPFELVGAAIPRFKAQAIAPNDLYSEAYYPRARYVDDAAGHAYIEQVVPAGRLARPEEIGELIGYLATMQGSFMTGAIIDFSGGWPVALAPPRPSDG